MTEEKVEKEKIEDLGKEAEEKSKKAEKVKKEKKVDVEKLKDKLDKVENKKAEAKIPKEKPSFVLTVGKRKRAIARALVKPGKGLVKVNSLPLDNYQNELARMKMQEPLILSGDFWKAYDIDVNVRGGGIIGQADAVRQSIAKGLVEFNPELRERFITYDRNLLVFDPRRTEPCKPGPSKARTHKQRSKR